MVLVAFKTVYLFLALFALPHVLAVPGVAALGPRLTLRDEALDAHNAARQLHDVPRLTWTGNLEALAMLHAVLCESTANYSYENLAYTDSVTQAVRIWTSNKKSQDYTLLLGKKIREFGCATANCDGHRLVVCMYGR